MIILTSLVNKIKANLKKIAIITVAVLLGLFGFKACRKVQQKQDKQATNTVLQPNQKEKIVVDPTTHEIIITTDKGTTKTYLPDRPTQIIENKDGSITVIDHKFGVEIRPFIGVGGAFDCTPRVHVGADVFYFHKLDLGIGVNTNPSELKDIRTDLSLGYNFWSNTSVALSIDNHRVPGLFLKVRF
jgi:hypothetical protein